MQYIMSLSLLISVFRLKREGETVTARAKSRQSTLASAANEGRKKITKRLRSGRVIHYSCSSDLDSETDGELSKE